MDPPSSRFTRRTLALWLHFRDRPMTIRGVYAYNRRFFSVMLILSLCVFTIAYGLGYSLQSVVFDTAIISVWLRDFILIRRNVKNWPTIREVIDWKKLEFKLINSPATEAPAP